MKLEHLAYFKEIAACHSLNEASEKLFISHQALSKIVTALEMDFGTKLVERTMTGSCLTTEGIALANNIDDILLLLSEMRQQIDKVIRFET